MNASTVQPIIDALTDDGDEWWNEDGSEGYRLRIMPDEDASINGLYQTARIVTSHEGVNRTAANAGSCYRGLATPGGRCYLEPCWSTCPLMVGRFLDFPVEVRARRY